MSEWVVFEDWGKAIDMVREGVELALTGGAESKCPDFRFYLPGACCRDKFRGWAVSLCACGDGSRAGARRANRVMVHGVDVGVAVVEAITVSEREVH